MTTPHEPLHALTCPTCGAPLDVIPEEVTLKCKYCSSVIENPAYTPPPPPAPKVEPAPARPHPQPQSRPGSKAGCWAAAVFALVLGAFILSVNWLSSPHSGSAKLFSSGPDFKLQVHPPVIEIDDGSGAPGVIAPTYDIPKNSYALSRLDMTSHKTLWSVMGQADYLRIDALVAGDTLVYAALGNRLVALRLDDGKQAWEASLPDKPVCRACLILLKGQVIALTRDNSLGAYEAMSGHQTWEKHFENTGYRLYPAGGGVALKYGIKVGAALGVFDPLTGSEMTRIEPACKDPSITRQDEMGILSNIVIDNAAQPKVYVFYGLFNACVQRWDLSTGQKDWEHQETGANLDNSRDIPVLFSGGTLYYIQQSQLRALDAATGQQSKTLDDSSDYALVPLAIDGQRLVARATRTSGSRCCEMWGYDVSSGKKLWTKPLINSTPLDPPNEETGLITADESRWTMANTPDGLWLITFQTKPNKVNLALLNLDTGELTRQKSLALGLGDNEDFYDTPEHIASRDPLAWFSLDTQVYAIDLPNGVFSVQWP